MSIKLTSVQVFLLKLYTFTGFYMQVEFFDQLLNCLPNVRINLNKGSVTRWLGTQLDFERDEK